MGKITNRIGETAVANCGMEMTIIAYRGNKDVDVRFEDGQEVYHKSYSNFKKGTIAPPRDPQKERVGETAVAKCGMKMTIIAYRGCDDIDVRFEDGQEVHHKRYQCFKSGTIAPLRDLRKESLKERVGETAVANCGMEMTIIAYRSFADLDVRFEDGQEVYHKAYSSFKKGAIAPPQYPRHKKHIGETAVANCGMKMTIIAYRSSRDVDVRFEDGQEVHHKTYQGFKKGGIAPPRDLQKEKIGETAVANCGMEMTIIAYRSSRDVDVRFEDGQEVYHKSYSNFKSGTIAPLRDLRKESLKERVGETAVATCGMKMTIIAYRSANDIDVRFEDGQESYHKMYSNFKKGTIAPQRDLRKERVGETAVATCGMKMTIIAYRSASDVDVRFEDGQEAYHKEYRSFKIGTIAPPRDLRKERVGETAVATCGMEMTIIAYRSVKDLDVRFEDGQESYHKSYGNFKNGTIAPPRDPRKERVGETATANCGMKMTIIAYRGCDDIDVRFEDGQKVYHKAYQGFKKGTIAPPQDPRYKERIGETAVANCGMEMTIIAYRSARDIDVRFEDGQESYHKMYCNFKIGNIAPQRDLRKERVGETAVATCGMEMTIIAYRSTNDIDVRFEDGQEVYHKGYGNFKSGEIAHPQFPMMKIGKYNTLTTRFIGRIPTGEAYFIAKCTRCGEVYAGTPQMIIAANHKCKEKNCAKSKTH